VNVKVSPESMDAHVHVLKQNGYSIQKRAYVFTTCLMCFLAGLYLMGLLTQ
jgi:hypothetical protein